MGVEINRFDVYLVNLDPSLGKEIKKTRLCLIVSPNEMNHHLDTVIIAPMTSAKRNYPSRIDCRFRKISGQIALDQIRTIDKIRLLKKLGRIDKSSMEKSSSTLLEMFSI